MFPVAFLFLMQTQTTSGAAVLLRTVDRDAIAVPGIEIVVQQVSDCNERVRTGAESLKLVTRDDGAVSFTIPRYSSHMMRTSSDGEFEATERCLTINDIGAARYLQIVMRPDPRNRITIVEPSEGASTRQTHLVLHDFTGVYEDSAHHAYDVGVADSGAIEVEGPDGPKLLFSRRLGAATFAGPSGTIIFNVRGTTVTGLTFRPTSISAERLPEKN